MTGSALRNFKLGRFPELWVAVIAALCFVAFPDDLSFATSVLVTAIFVLSLDLVLGYAGIVTLGINQNYSQIIIGAVVIVAVVLNQINSWLAKRRLLTAGQ